MPIQYFYWNLAFRLSANRYLLTYLHVVFAGRVDISGKAIKLYNKQDVFRAFACVIDYMYFFDENTTVNGTVYMIDLGHYTMKLHTYVSLEERRDFLHTWQVTCGLFCLVSQHK